MTPGHGFGPFFHPGAMDLNGKRDVSLDWEHNPGAMILCPVEYKKCVNN